MKGVVDVIGAGPGGSAAALLLARAGFAVTLIEQSRFPRDKVCGECLSATGIEVLERLGLSARLARLNPVVLTHARIHSTKKSGVRMPLPRPMWGISRAVLDQYLLDAAREAGAEVLQPARCEGIEAGAEPTVRVRRLDSNQSEVRHPDWVILADGKAAFEMVPPVRTGDFGIKTHLEQVEGPRDTIELFGCAGLYGGLAPIERGRWNVAFSVPAKRLRKHRGNIEALFGEILSENQSLARRLSGSRRVSDWLAAPLPRFPVHRAWAPRFIPVGNAAAALEPIGGEGMGLALASAEVAVAALLEPSPDANDAARLEGYRTLWRVRRPACRAAAQLVSRPPLAAAIVSLAPCFPFLADRVLRLLGK